MDKQANIQALQDQIKSFCDERDWDQFHNAKDLAIGIVTESAELLDHFRFKNGQEVEDLFKDKAKRQEIEEEMADVFYFLLRLSERYDVDLSKALENKLKKNAIKYPVDKVKGNNKKYNEY